MTATVQQIRKAMADLAGIIETHPNGECVAVVRTPGGELAFREDRTARLAAAKAASQAPP
ncbi:hypothetical protein [Rhizobium sp. GN54]|uniref:hypothetical protein n=1 Tax=Rhizobium sp. GN54 TaxID=2898150 RepID=UPI001E613834|nr:hypothetical protein [Rhizobium sp. GN54]